MCRAFAASVLLALGLMSAPVIALADGQTVQTPQQEWARADNCGKEAFKKYPDYTADSNLKREQFRRECLREHEVAAPDTPLGTGR